MTDHNRGTPRRGRARKRAIRAQAARAGVAYSVAARQLDAVGLQSGETIASYGRTIYPAGHDTHRQRLVEERALRTFEQRRADTRRAALLPDGRAQHLVERFPPTRGRPGSRVGMLYHGEGRQGLLSMLYSAVAARAPGLVPPVGSLAWIAEMGEETAVDMECADLDREARALVGREPFDGPHFTGVRQILDALLMVANDGHAPGARVRILTDPYRNRTATIVGAEWGPPGPPTAYRVQVEGTATVLTTVPGELVVLAGQ
ncbi:hypothetical protein OHA21_50610 [Actinoplanes sp. NBC_00393]|uniref:hypothetical protein n=1 Tax=Actinoplanes sp. NBC_00393 TaxID=2975953 RepID=UPI002E1A69DA